MNYCTNGKIYNSQDIQNLDREEIQYLSCFQRLASAFNPQYYDILINKEDYGRLLFVDLIDRISLTAVKIYLKDAHKPIDDPVNGNVIQAAINHFQSGNEEKLILNRRV
ncbi:hypothetical protein DSM106972_095150 [Dulcicalothrix desertica PCC 7102]|uniref:Uncharacterized protein n=1 Tax=Dulcicalothrix desertica PCC 7102 TaxID=232991 RepID=A0A3S1BYU0_9CYAN|nr:hypothetical protein [Dulcicalothrix desertica]RUS93916.1 hypothetical protein DSM106972_095150 [Dulcicalothrix desertica PCC 7102]TWH61604.1 hypothetical protein CAL7102_00827 [Dulcicalothrix desertica PCC 7102]